MMKMEEELYNEIIAETTEAYLNNLSLLKKGFKLALYNAALRDHTPNLKLGEATKANIVTTIAIEAFRKMGIDAEAQEKLYKKYRLKVRSDVIKYIGTNEETNKKFLKEVERFKKFEKMQGSRLSKVIIGTNKVRRHIRDKFIKRKKRNY